MMTLPPRVLIAGLGIGGIGLFAAGVILGRALNLAACPLCILQRMAYLLLAFESAVAIAFLRSTLSVRLAALVMAATAALGAAIAGYQTWIQRFARDVSCTADQPWWEQFVNWAGTLAPLFFESTGLCNEAGWKFLSLSIAEWSLVIFTAMTCVAIHTTWKTTKDIGS